MTWKPIVAGVDASPEGGWAAAVSWQIAQKAGVPAFLVHAVPAVGAFSGGTPGSTDVSAIRAAILDVARRRVLETLPGGAPEESFEKLEVLFGRPAGVLTRVAREREAGLIVLGGKHHRALARWFAGNTAVDVARLSAVPTLVATQSLARVGRILAAVDLSSAAGPTIAAAEAFAKLFGAKLRVLHALEPVPLAAELPTPVDPRELAQSAQSVLEHDVWPKIALPAERVVREGGARSVIAAEATEWQADLVIMGSHGKGWIDRVLLGSLTEALLRHLPASLLVVPTSAPVAHEEREPEQAASAADQ
jgi:nucleotide-binding universal stress UspA family protein